jgi:hypothetical protein
LAREDLRQGTDLATLLVRKISVCGQEDVEVDCGQHQQLAILLASPPHLWSGLHVMPTRT